jgi:hypothetical protein
MGIRIYLRETVFASAGDGYAAHRRDRGWLISSDEK